MASHSQSLLHGYGLIAVLLFLLPFSLSALTFNYAVLALVPSDTFRKRVRRHRRFHPRTVIITGSSTLAGLRAARALYDTGHNPIGVDFGISEFRNYAHRSRTLQKSYTVRGPSATDGASGFIEDLLRIIDRHRANLWIDCAAASTSEAMGQARRVVEQKSICACFAPDLSLLRSIENEKTFASTLKSTGLPSLDTHLVMSRDDIHRVLGRSQGKRRYLLKAPNGAGDASLPKLFPRRSVSQTYHDISQIKITKTMPWVLEEYLEDRPRFSAAAILVQGKVKAFSANTLEERSLPCRAVPSSSSTSQVMLHFMEALANGSESTYSGHLAIDFCVNEKITASGVVQQMLPLACRTEANPSLLFFEGKSGSFNLARAYLSMLDSSMNALNNFTGLPQRDSEEDTLQPGGGIGGVFFFSQDLRQLLLGPLIDLVRLRIGLTAFLYSVMEALTHFVFWKEAIYDVWDPLPFFWYCHVLVPSQLLGWHSKQA